jgi:streptogramin lyase
VWYFDVGQNLVGRVTPAGSITQFAVPGTGAGSEAIAGGADGNIWMVAQEPSNGPDWILKVSPAGVITRFPLAKGIGPEGITWGPDGNIWFTEFWTGRVGRMTPAGVITEFSLGGDSNPRGIVTGPDHNLWFVEGSLRHESIGRMTIKGDVVEYPLGSNMNQQLQPYNIVTGPDGNVWFGEIGHIGRITPAGVVTHFVLPGQNSGATGVVGGADGNVWFTNQGANTVGRITPTGTIHQYPLPKQNAQPVGIASGSDGRVWFTEAGVSRIASIGTTVPEATLSSRVLTFAGGSVTTREVSVTNTGETKLAITGIKLVGSDQGAFTIAHDDCTGRRVAVQASCRIDVAFKPGSDSGLRAARLAITDNATASPQSVSLVAQLPDCKLPVFTSTESTAQGGFLNLRDGAVTPDPKGGFVPGGRLSHSQASPVLYGQLPAIYDPAAGRWVPGVPSPDGSRYAYTDYGQGPAGGFTVHVVDLASGRDRALNLSHDFWSVLAFTADGIYLHKGYEGAAPGLWVVDPDSGSLRTLFTDSVVMAVSGQTAWIGATDTSDPLPQPPGEGGGYNELQSRDLKTSTITTWIRRSGTNLGFVNAAGGSILVAGYDIAGSHLWAVRTPGNAEEITDPATGDPFANSSGSVAGPDGWWLAGFDGLYLWTARTGAVLVSEVTAPPAGACA